MSDLSRGLVLERERRRQRLEHRLRSRVGADARDAGQHAVAEQVDVAGVGQPRHAHVRDPRGDLVLLERGREELAGLREQPQAVVGALAIGDLHDHRADPDHLAAGRVHRVVAGQPVAPLAHLQGGVVGRLRVHDRLARLEHAAVERDEHGRELADDFAEVTADVLLRREPVDRRERVVDPHEAEVAVPEADPDRGRDEQRVQLRVRLLRCAEEQRVVDRERRTPRELACEREVELAEAPARLAGTERDRAQHPAPRLERHDDVGHRLQTAVEREVVLVDGGVGQSLLSRILDEVRLAGGQHLRDRMGLVRIRRIVLAELAQQLRPLWVAVRDHDLAQPAVVDHVDDAVVGEPRHEQSRERIEGCVDIDRRSEDGTRLVDELRPLARLPIGGDVVDDVDHVLDGAVAGDDRRRADERPALLTVRQEPVADEALLGLAGDDRATVWEVVGGERLPVVADHEEALHQLRPGEPEQLVARRQPEQARGGVVRIGERPVHALRRDPLGDVVEDDIEPDSARRERGEVLAARIVLLVPRECQGDGHAAIALWAV